MLFGYQEDKIGEMRKIVTVVAVFLPLIVGIFIVRSSLVSKNSATKSSPVLGKDQGSGLIKIDYKGQKYSASLIRVDNIDNLSLIPNFDQKITASQAKEKYQCKYLTSAGFYLDDNTPAGLFITDGKVLKNWLKNDLFNGILSVNDMAIPRITTDLPKDHLIYAVQSGPLVRENAKNINLYKSNDKPSRRVLAAVSGDNILYFFSIYNPDQVFDGPYLRDLPDIVSLLEDQSKIVFADVVNLDGGSASTFYSESASLPEISPVGAFFCIK